MRRALLASCSLLALLPALSFPQERTVYLTPLVSFDSYSALDLGNGMSFGASLSADVAGPVRVTCAALFGTRSVAFDRIGRRSALDVHVNAYAGSVSVRILGNREGGELAAALGGGAVVSSVDALTVPAGGLGSITVPSRSETRGFITAGLAAALPFSSRVALTCEPSLRFVTPLASAPVDFIIAGGIRVSLF